jgi:hypothetical protein
MGCMLRRKSWSVAADMTIEPDWEIVGQFDEETLRDVTRQLAMHFGLGR